MRDLQKAGKLPQFGSFIYSARLWYDKGILLSIDQYSPLQYDKMDVVLSSNTVGVFNVEIRNHALGVSNRIAMADVKMEELLQAQYEDRASLSMFNGLAKFNLKLLLYQINKKSGAYFLSNSSLANSQTTDFMSDAKSILFSPFYGCNDLSRISCIHSFPALITNPTVTIRTTNCISTQHCASYLYNTFIKYK